MFISGSGRSDCGTDLPDRKCCSRYERGSFKQGLEKDSRATHLLWMMGLKRSAFW
jgi:3'-phosphoadenosine 5'-phosphosulfate sulfotransferase (PAPS reductase)/FAD synthetase